MRGKWFVIGPIGILAIALFTFIGGQIVMGLWNALLPELFGWPHVTFWQALGLLVLCRILFGGHGFSRRASGAARTEARERIRQRMRERFGFPPSASEGRES
jgi:uncharacterized membrane protein